MVFINKVPERQMLQTTGGAQTAKESHQQFQVQFMFPEDQ